MLQALKPTIIGVSAASSMLLYTAIAVAKVPILWFYGIIGGVGANPMDGVLRIFGALLSEFYFARKFGKKSWKTYAPVLLAGYACGMGLVGIGCVALSLISVSVTHLPY